MLFHQMILIFCMTLSFQTDLGLKSDICIFKMELCSLTVFLLVYGIYFLIIIFT